jgi:hypothetical protein
MIISSEGLVRDPGPGDAVPESAVRRRPRYLLGGILATMLASPQPALAQLSPSCVISPDPPIFEAGAGAGKLHPVPPPEGAKPHTLFHGQGLYGSDTLYLSHLPVFMGQPRSHPHNFQVILEVEFEDPKAKAIYKADRAQHPDVIYTAGPPVFNQDMLATPNFDHSLLHFPGSKVFRGHFEQGGKSIIEDTTLAIRRVVHFREFLLDGSKLRNQHYLLFGRAGDVFLSHLLSAPPDFDQFLAAELEVRDTPSEAVGKQIADLLAQGLYVRLTDRENAEATRLRAGAALTCTLEAGTVAAAPVTVELRTTDELYCEAGEFTKLVLDRFNDARRCEG